MKCPQHVHRRTQKEAGNSIPANPLQCPAAEEPNYDVSVEIRHFFNSLHSLLQSM